MVFLIHTIQTLSDLAVHVPEVPVQVWIEYACGQLCMYIQGGPVEIRTPTHRNLIGRTTTVLPVVLSPSICFRHLRLTVFSFRQGKSPTIFKKFYHFLNCEFGDCPYTLPLSFVFLVQATSFLNVVSLSSTYRIHRYSVRSKTNVNFSLRWSRCLAYLQP